MSSVKEDRVRRARTAVRAVLPSATEVQTLTGDETADLVIQGRPLRLYWAGEGWLRQIRSVLKDTRRHPDIVAARRMSPGAREALSKAGIGWVDETGAAEIAIGSIVVSRTGKSGKPEPRPPRWTPSMLAVTEALICGTNPTVAAVESATGLSTGSCATALRTLTELELLTADAKRGPTSARRIADEDALLDSYAFAATALAPKIGLQVGVIWQDVIAGLAEVGHQWDRAGLEWAVTGAAASLLVAPFLSTVQTAGVYVAARTMAELQAATERTGLKPIEGGRLTLKPFPTVATARLAGETEGIRLAPWPRIYADLRTEGVRGEEAAEHLREVMHGR